MVHFQVICLRLVVLQLVTTKSHGRHTIRDGVMVHRCPSLRLVCLPVSRRKSPKSNNQDRTNGLETTTESDSRQTRWLDCFISIREAISFCAPTKRGPGFQNLPGVGKAFLSHPTSFQIRYIFGPKRYVSVIGGLLKHSHMFSEFLMSYRHWKIYNYDKNVDGMASGCCLIIRED